MKKIYLSILSLLLIVNCFAQNEYKKGSTLGFSFTLHDFKTPAAIKSKGLVNVIREKQLFKVSDMDAGVGINYLKGISNCADFTSTFGVSSLSSSINAEVTAGINLKLLTDKYFAVPFINAGIGANAFEVYYAAFMPVGTGLQLNFSRDVFFLLNSQYRIPVTQNASSNFYYSFTIAANIGK